MSKASQIAKLNAESRWNSTGNFADVNEQGSAVVCSRYSESRIMLDADEALSLAKWLLDTFGEEPSK